jgi:HEAT repeat protein
MLAAGLQVPGQEDGARYDKLLVAGLAHERPDIAEMCAWVLGQRRATHAVQPLSELLRRRPRDVAVCVAAAGALAEIRDPAAVPALHWVFEHGYASVRAAAVRALARIDSQAARAVLERVAEEDPAAGVRDVAGQLLQALRREDQRGCAWRP